MTASKALGPRDGNAGVVEAGLLDLEIWLPYQGSVVSNRVSACLASMYGQRFGLTVSGWRVMAVLARYQPLSAKELAHRTAMDQVKITRAIGAMMSVGLINRRIDRADGRRLVLRLSRRGLDAYRQIVPLAQGIEAALLDSVTPAERAALRSAGRKVLRRAEEILPEGVNWRRFLDPPERRSAAGATA